MIHDIKMENEKKNREKLENIKRWKRDERFELKKILEEEKRKLNEYKKKK